MFGAGADPGSCRQFEGIGVGRNGAGRAKADGRDRVAVSTAMAA
jgi:hypothetical protein